MTLFAWVLVALGAILLLVEVFAGKKQSWHIIGAIGIAVIGMILYGVMGFAASYQPDPTGGGAGVVIAPSERFIFLLLCNMAVFFIPLVGVGLGYFVRRWILRRG